MLTNIAIVILCYIIGSIPFSLIFGKLLGRVDIRTRGSGNIGATNVLRTAGLSVALLALLADIGKGLIAAWLGIGIGGTVMAALCCIAVIGGHCYSVFLRFQGGKGVATSAGIIAFLMPDILVVLLVTVILAVVITRYMSLGSIIAALLFPVLTAFIFPQPVPYIILSIIMAIMVLYRHKENIKRLLAGQESKITDKA